MKKEDHFLLTFSISLYIYYFLFKDLKYLLIGSILTAFFSWLPDLDIKVLKKIEKIKKKKRIVYYLLFPCFYLIKKLLKHRGLTHSIYFPIFLIYLDYITEDFLVSFFLKTLYLSILLHILEDSLTKTGVSIVYPLNFKFKIPIFSTNNNIHSFLIKIKAFLFIIIFLFFVKI
ncbi:MAG TPA: hypothetical protein EYH54_01305 [Nautiliaceae bacterium]|nr:hypothetical protein [Nautiliaceae bacterium]